MMNRRWPNPLGAISVAASLILTVAVQAGPLPPVVEVTETLMDAQGAEATLLGRLFGPDDHSPLSFSNTLDFTDRRFSFSLDAGSTYLGRPLTLTGVGAFDSTTGAYAWSTTGMLGSTPWAGTGSLLYSGITGVLNVSWEVLGNEFDLEAMKNVPKDKPSSLSISFTVNSVPVSMVTIPDGIDVASGRWTWGEGTAVAAEHAFAVTSNGSFSPTDGTGTFTTRITSVPEPSTATLLGLGLFVLAASSRRRRAKVV